MDLLLPDFIQKKIRDPGFRRYFKNTGWLFVGKVVGMVISFFVGAYIARYLGPNNYGLLNYAYSFVGVFAFLASFGIDTILTRELVKAPQKSEELLGTAFITKLLGGLVVVFISILGALIIHTDRFTFILITLYSFNFIFQATNVVDTYFQSNVLAKKTVKVQLGVAVLLTVVKLALIAARASVVYFMVVTLIESVLIGAGMIIMYHSSKQSIFNWKFSRALQRNMLRDSWPLLFSTAFYFVYLRIDQIIIKQMMDNTAVGVYAVAVRIAEVWYFIPGIICASLFPAIVNAKKTGDDVYKIRLQRLYTLMVWLAVAVALPISVFSGLIIKLLFGSAYAAAAGVLRVYIWAGVATFLGTAIIHYLLVENYTKINLAINIIGATSNVILNILFIPLYGIKGAAVATLISYSLVPLSLFLFKKTRRNGLLMLKAFVLKF